jgi:hypothetical protein
MTSPTDETQSDIARLALHDRDRLKQIADNLLFSDHRGNRRDAVVALHALFANITGLGCLTRNPADHDGTLLPAGEALSPEGAAACILDVARTATFLRGAFAAVRAALTRFTHRPIEILYAGCGPFAALAIPLTTQFTAADIRFWLLDAHPRSLESARRLVRALDLDAYVGHYIQADATSYVHEPDGPLHMVISETMQRALAKEPQVAIMLNLAPQLCAGGILIPENIAIDACLFDLEKEFAASCSGEAVPCSQTRDSRRTRIELGRVFEIGVDTARRLAAMRSGHPLPDAGFPTVVLDVPEGADKDLHVMLRTEITVFGAAVLREYESGLTNPAIAHELGRIGDGRRMEFRYVLGSNPGFAHRWVDRAAPL